MPTILKRCPHKHCHTLISLDSTDCGGHISDICIRCGEKTWSKKSKYCFKCRGEMKEEIKERNRKQAATESPEDLAQAELNKKIDRDLAARKGHGQGKVRTVPPEEWAKLNITHISQVPKRRFIGNEPVGYIT